MKDSKYKVRPLKVNSDITVQVPGSKSITNRALLLSALAKGESKICNALFSDDSRNFLKCLKELGFKLNIDEKNKTVIIKGENGVIPNGFAKINVGSAGTAARFLTAMTALSGGEYVIDASEQMKKRPMKPLFEALKSLGVEIKYLEKEDFLPIKLRRTSLKNNRVAINIESSSQFLSAMLMSAIMCENGLEIEIQGNRQARSYVDMTVRMMEQFDVCVDNISKDIYRVKNGQAYVAKEYYVEPDVSAACYFYAMAMILNTSVIVSNVHYSSMQGDLKFLDVIKKMGGTVEETEVGLKVSGTKNGVYNGIEIDMSDFSDQTMTLAAMAVYAQTPTSINNIEHIRYQESDRITAIVTELGKMGIKYEERKDGLTIFPSKPNATHVETYNDHRMAMAFSLIGLRTEGITILNPACCNKTFEDYFNILDRIIEENSI